MLWLIACKSLPRKKSCEFAGGSPMKPKGMLDSLTPKEQTLASMAAIKIASKHIDKEQRITPHADATQPVDI